MSTMTIPAAATTTDAPTTFPTFAAWITEIHREHQSYWGVNDEQKFPNDYGQRLDQVADLLGYVNVSPEDADGALLLADADGPSFDADPDVARWAVYEYRATRTAELSTVNV